MKLGNLNELKTLILNKSDEKTSFKTARKMLKALKWIDSDENLPFFESKRNEIISRYAKKDEEGNYVTNQQGGVQFAPEDTDDVNKEYTVLFLTEIEVPADLKFTPEELEGFNFSLKDMAILEELLED